MKNVDGIQRILSGCEGETWVFSGHWHADTFVRMGLQRHVITTCTGYLFPMDTLPHDRKAPGYRLIEIRDGKVHTRFKPLGAVAVEDPPIDVHLTQEEALRALGK